MRLGYATGSALALVSVLSCFSDRTAVAPIDPSSCEIPGSAIGPDRVVVLVRGFGFQPDTVRIRPGTTVTWVNCEPSEIEAHTATSQTEVWDSGLLPPGSSYAQAFPTPGSYPYFCRPHSFMRGAVIVE